MREMRDERKRSEREKERKKERKEGRKKERMSLQKRDCMWGLTSLTWMLIGFSKLS